MRIATCILAVLSCLAASGELSRVDADGVTETGGAPKYARMLPRTGTNGLLSATLLPPVADWASQPIARLYYAAAGASVQGNGSPQYPFNDLTYALSHMSGQSALLLAPGSYSGSGSVASGQTVTLFGVGGQARVTSLAVTALGSSPYTTLDLCGLAVDALRVDGGRVNIRLCATAVGMLSGDASAATVTRTDMASRIGASTLTHVDTYSGYPFAPEAGAVVSGDGLRAITLSGPRGVVVDGAVTNTIAHVSDVTSATGAVYATIGGLVAADSAMSARIDDEMAARSGADTALSNNLAQVISALSGDLGSLSSTWGSHLSAINSRITGLDTGLATLGTRQSNDTVTLTASIAQVRSDFTAADSDLDASLRDVISNNVSGLRGDIPGIADARAAIVFSSRIVSATNNAVTEAVRMAKAYSDGRDSTISSQVAALDSSVDGLRRSVDSNTVYIVALLANDGNLSDRISSLNARVDELRTTVTNLSVSVSALKSWRTQANGQITDLEADIETVTDKINIIIDSMSPLTNRYYSPISLPTKL